MQVRLRLAVQNLRAPKTENEYSDFAAERAAEVQIFGRFFAAAWERGVSGGSWGRTLKPYPGFYRAISVPIWEPQSVSWYVSFLNMV